MIVAAVVGAFVPTVIKYTTEQYTEQQVIQQSVSDSHIRDIAAQEASKIQPGVTQEYVDSRVADCQSVTNNKYVEILRDVQGYSQKVADAASTATAAEQKAAAVESAVGEVKNQSATAVSVAEKAKHHSHWFLILGSICGLSAMAVLITVAVRQRRKQRGKQAPKA